MDFRNIGLNERIKEFNHLRKKYPDKIPIIVNRFKNSDIEEVKKKKYLVNKELNLSQFMMVFRKNLTVDQTTAIFLTINDEMVPNNIVLSSIYASHKNEDGFLYIDYSTENTFG